MTKNDEQGPFAPEEPRRKRKWLSKRLHRLMEVPDVLQLKNVASDGKTSEADGSELLELLVLALRGTVVFPLTVVPLRPRTVLCD